MFDKDVYIIVSNTVNEYHGSLTVNNTRINAFENILGFYNDFDYGKVVNFKLIDTLPKDSIKLIINFSMLPLHPNIYLEDNIIDYINKTDNTYFWMFSPHEATLDFNILKQALKDKKINNNKVIISNNSYYYHTRCKEDIKFVCIKDWWESYYKFHLRVWDDVSFVSPETRLKHLQTANKKVLTLNRNIKDFRIWNYYALIKTGLYNDSHVSYHIPTIAMKNNINYIDLVDSAVKFFENDTRRDIMITDKLYISKNLDKLDNRHIINYKDNIIPYYNDSLTSVVVESLLDENFITEKSYKAITHSHPFIVVGHKDIQHRLRLDGYKTFDELYEEDGISSLETALKVYKHLQSYDINVMRKDIQDKYMQIVDYNFNHFFERKPSFSTHINDIKHTLSKT